jgi:hypothetical protein
MTSKLVVVVAAPPSVTVTVMVATPLAFGTVVMVILRSAPLPLKVMLLTGTKLVFDELALSLKALAAVSASPTDNTSAPLESLMH